jgi:hypothetical protein
MDIVIKHHEDMDAHQDQAIPLADSRVRRLYDELAFAVSRTDGATLRQWGGRSAGRLLNLTARRIGGLASMAASIGKGAWSELSNLMKAAGHGAALEHVGDRTAAAIDGSIALGKDGARILSAISHGMISKPKETAPTVLGAFLGFYAGSGGVDGNGGIPDLDLLAGIDAHRSILTHSILAGIIAEGALLAIADLAAQVHERLPIDHDLLWDELAKSAAPLTTSLATGTSAGIAYHLLVDAFIQPAPYHDLPFSMPIEGHQAAMAASGMAEGVDASRSGSGRGPVVILQDGLPEKSTGRKIVDGVASAASSAQTAAADGVANLKKLWRASRKSS